MYSRFNYSVYSLLEPYVDDDINFESGFYVIALL